MVSSVIKSVKKVFVYSLLVSLAFYVGCTEVEDCAGDRKRAKTLENFGCENVATTAIVLTSSEFSFLRNQEDFESIVKTLCRPSIDWSEYDLIAGNISSEYTVTDIRPFVRVDCSTSTVIVDIQIQESTILNPSEVAFTAIFPKLENDQELFVNFE